MTLKYESELLFDLMKRDGDDAPSDVLPYESELKEKYLNQVVGAYPKLQDYRPEWLNYNLYHHLPSDFPDESVANVTSASFNNVVPYAYKSAILKGNTLVNVIKDTTKNGYNTLSKGITTLEDGWIRANASASNNHFELKMDNLNLKTSTTYMYIIECRKNTFTGNGSTFQFGDTYKSNIDTPWTSSHVINELPLGIYTFKLTTKSDFSSLTNPIGDRSYLCGGSGEIEFRYMIIEYQEGMENWDIPYFTGMQSVKLPVLTTSNEDGTKTNILTVNEEVELHGIGEVKDELNLLTGELLQKTEKIIFDGSEAWEVVSSLEKDNTIFAQCYKYTRNNTNTISNILDYISSLDALDKRGFRFNHFFQIRLNKNEISNITNNGVKEWVSKNNIIVVRVEEQTVKTVDLRCINEQGESVKFRPLDGTMYVSTSSQTLPPLLDMSVPVEATSQNLMSFANIEEEE